MNKSVQSSTTFDQSLLILIETIDRELQQTISTTLFIDQSKETSQQIYEKHSTSLFNHLFAEQRTFLTDTIEQQDKHWDERIKQIVGQTINELRSSFDTLNTPRIAPSLHTNQPDNHLFKVSIKSTESVRLHAKLFIAAVQYPRKSHTLCQRYPIHDDQVTCYIAPPAVDGPYEAII